MKEITSIWDKLWHDKIDFRSIDKRWKWIFTIWAVLSLIPIVVNLSYIAAPYSTRISAMPWLVANIISIMVFVILCIAILVENHRVQRK